MLLTLVDTTGLWLRWRCCCFEETKFLTVPKVGLDGVHLCCCCCSCSCRCCCCCWCCCCCCCCCGALLSLALSLSDISRHSFCKTLSSSSSSPSFVVFLFSNSSSNSLPLSDWIVSVPTAATACVVRSFDWNVFQLSWSKILVEMKKTEGWKSAQMKKCTKGVFRANFAH